MDEEEGFKVFIKKELPLFPENWINEFLSFVLIDNENNEDKFCVNIKKIAEWLRMKKKTNITRMLKNKNNYFEKDIDYIIKIKPNPKGVGKPVHDVFTTTDCFKNLCMLSQTDQGKLVRRYYVQLENVLKKYHKLIYQKMINRVSKLENNRKPKPKNKKRRIIYFFETPDSKNIIKDISILNPRQLKYLILKKIKALKLGKSKSETTRETNQNNVVADNLNIGFKIEVSDVDLLEKLVKIMLKDLAYRQNKEIFIISEELLINVIITTNNIINDINKYKSDCIKNGADYFVKKEDQSYLVV